MGHGYKSFIEAVYIYTYVEKIEYEVKG